MDCPGDRPPMLLQEESWHARDGTRLHAVIWNAEGPPTGVIAMVHGIGEHIRRYDHVAAHMNRSRYAMLGFDLRGHGRSEGRRGDAQKYEILMDDIDVLMGNAGTKFPGVPCFLYGHSMGGNLVLNYMLRRKSRVTAAVVTGPGLKPASLGSRFKLFWGHVLRFAAPGLLVSNEVEPRYLSRDTDVVKKYISDPLVHDRVSIRLALGLIDAGAWAMQHAGNFSQPLLLLQGGADRIVDVQTNLDFAKRAGPECRLKVWPGLYHEIHNEPEKEDVFEEIVDWLDRYARRQSFS